MLSVVLERINSFYMLFHSKIRFGFRTFRFPTNFQERIKFENRGSTVLGLQLNSQISIAYILDQLNLQHSNPQLLVGFF